MNTNVFQSLCIAGLLIVAVPVLANEVEPIYGNQLMTQQERLEHQAQMRAAKTPEEKRRLRQLHHQKMKLRAQKRGVPFSDLPPAERGRMNQLEPQKRGLGQD